MSDRPLLGYDLAQKQIDAFVVNRYAAGASLRTAIKMGRAGIMPMTGGGEVALRKTQSAIESTKGTTLAATRKVYGSGMMDKLQPLIVPQREDRGTFVDQYRSQAGLIEAVFPFKASLTYEDLPWWCQLALKGGVTGVLSAVTVYTYTFLPTQTSDDLKTATFEWGDDTQAWVMPFGMVDSLEIVGVLGRPWEATITIIGADMTAQTFTGALSDRVVEDIETHLTKFAVGAAGAVPAGYVTGQVKGFKFSCKNQLKRKFFMDGAANPAKMGGVGRMTRDYTLEVTYEGNAATITERGTWASGTNRVARITATGSIIAGSTGNVVRSADLILPGKYSNFKVGNHETNTTWLGILEGEYDTALGYDLSLAIANALVTLP